MSMLKHTAKVSAAKGADLISQMPQSNQGRVQGQVVPEWQVDIGLRKGTKQKIAETVKCPLVEQTYPNKQKVQIKIKHQKKGQVKKM